MKIRLLKSARINHKAGEIVEVSPAEANYYIGLNSAVAVKEEKPKTKKAVKK